MDEDMNFRKSLVFVLRLKQHCFLPQLSTTAQTMLARMEPIVHVVMTVQTVTLAAVSLVTRARSAIQVRP